MAAGTWTDHPRQNEPDKVSVGPAVMMHSERDVELSIAGTRKAKLAKKIGTETTANVAAVNSHKCRRQRPLLLTIACLLVTTAKWILTLVRIITWSAHTIHLYYVYCACTCAIIYTTTDSCIDGEVVNTSTAHLCLLRLP